MRNTKIEQEVLDVLKSRWKKGRATYGGGMRTYAPMTSAKGGRSGEQAR